MAATLARPAFPAEQDRAAAALHGPVARTADGDARGLHVNGVDVFLGIPYAAPPVGDLRWQPPHPVKAWPATRDATHYGNSCAQVTTYGNFAGPTSDKEDCLYLNIFAPSTDRSREKRPVIVWIHGGGNIDGASNDYDASKLATGGADGVPT